MASPSPSRASDRTPLARIVVRVKTGSDRMAATDDPVFLGIRGASGREYRLALRRGRGLRRGGEDEFVLAGPDDPATNVAHPELNDPKLPTVHMGDVVGVYFRKATDPIPNVRGIAELDDRLQIDELEIALHPAGSGPPLRFVRKEAFWLGLSCGMIVDVPPAEGS